MTDQPVTPDGLTDEQTVQAILRMTLQGQKALETRITKLYDPAYRTYRAHPQTKANVPSWRSQVRVPYAQANLDTALVNIIAGVPRCVVTPRHPADVQAAQAMQACLDYYVQEDHLVEKQPLFAQQGLVMGVTVAKNTWGYQEAAVTKRVWLPDPQGGDRLIPSVQTNPSQVVMDRPCFIPWSVYDCYWDPNGRDVDSCKYVVLNEWMGKDDLLERAQTPSNPNGWRNVDRLLANGASKTRPDTYQDTYLQQLNRHRGQFKISEVITDKATFTIGNDMVLLEAKANPYWHGKKNVVIAQTRPDLFELQGIPEVDLLRDIQDALHTLQNMTIDSVHLSVMRFATYREGSVVDPNMIVIRPQGKIPVGDHDDVRFPEIPPVNSDVFTERDRLKRDLDDVTGVNAALTGADINADTTATTASINSNAAGQLMRFKAAQIHFKGFQRTFEMWGSMIQQYQTRDMWVQIADPQTGEMAWNNVNPRDVAGDLRYRLVGSEEALSRQTARNESSALLAALFPYVQLGVVDPTELIVQLGQAYEVPNPQSLIKQQQPLPPAAPNGGGMQQGPPGGPPLPQALPSGMSLPQVVQQAIGGRTNGA